MIIKRLLISDKDIIEKLRIINYRFRKKRYSMYTKQKEYTTKINYQYLSNSLFFNSKQSVKNYSNEYKCEILSEANRLLNNKFRDISGNILEIGDSIDWNKDYVFNYKWDIKHYSDYILKNEAISTDVKHVWELSRFYHLLVLSQAYVISNNEVYVDKLVEDIFSWDSQNPINYSVNWTVSMEVAIRVVNLIESISLISESKRINNDTKIKLNKIVFMHGKYIWNNLEKGLNTNNHYWI